MAARELRIGIVGCGHAARVHLDRLRQIPGVCIVGTADPDQAAALALSAKAGPDIPSFTDHLELIRATKPEALAIFTPHLAHYHPAMDALRAGCHIFIEKPLSTNPQEAADIVNLARGRQRKVGVGHQFRLLPSLAATKARIAEGAIGPIRLVTATLAQPWLTMHSGAEHSWRFDPKVAGGGILADSGDHLLDALLWSTGQSAHEVAAIQSRLDSGLDVVTAAAIRLADGTPATLALSGVTDGSRFELEYYGERGRLRVDEHTFEEAIDGRPARTVPLGEPVETIDGNFVAAIVEDRPLCCPGEAALDTVRLLEAIARSVATGQLVRL